MTKNLLTIVEASNLIARYNDLDGSEARNEFNIDVIGHLPQLGAGATEHDWAECFGGDYIAGIEGGAVLAWGAELSDGTRRLVIAKCSKMSN